MAARAWLAGAVLGWGLLLGGAWAARAVDPHSSLAAVVYLAASRLCHQKPERSFQTAGVIWPVCGRCAGLYAAAPIGALLALRRRGILPGRRARVVLVVASLPTVSTLAGEWSGLAPVTTMLRAAAALPLGAAVAWVLVAAVPRSTAANQVH